MTSASVVQPTNPVCRLPYEKPPASHAHRHVYFWPVLCQLVIPRRRPVLSVARMGRRPRAIFKAQCAVSDQRHGQRECSGLRLPSMVVGSLHLGHSAAEGSRFRRRCAPVHDAADAGRPAEFGQERQPAPPAAAQARGPLEIVPRGHRIHRRSRRHRRGGRQHARGAKRLPDLRLRAHGSVVFQHRAAKPHHQQRLYHAAGQRVLQPGRGGVQGDLAPAGSGANGARRRLHHAGPGAGAADSSHPGQHHDRSGARKNS